MAQELKNQSHLNEDSIDIKDVLDFCKCPLYYKLKRDDVNDYNLKEAYDIAVHKCFYSYLMGIQQEDGRVGIDTLKLRWGKEWIKYKKNSEIICTPSSFTRDTYDAKRKMGIDAIITFNTIMNEYKQFPIAVNKKYKIQIAKNLFLTGTWEYIREIERNGENVIQIVKFCTEANKFRTLHQINHDLELTAAAYAFHKQFNVASFELVYIDIYTKKQIIANRTQNDFDLLKKTVMSVAISLKHNLSCTSPNQTCYHCEYRNVCSNTLSNINNTSKGEYDL